jgi:NAD(P)-dependent dehydrogenase (short-subunit alcohol dehydrogenase family)
VPPGIERLVLDVRDQGSIDAAIAEVQQKAGRIDVLVNNAGGVLQGAIEETDTKQAQALFDVNFFGAARMTRAVLPVMRGQGSGRILMMSSVLGFLPSPFSGYYSASKHALEGYSESLDHEVRPFGVRVVLIEPGFMKTRIDQNAAVATSKIEAYAAVRERVEASVIAGVEKGDDPALVARAVVEAATVTKPKLRYTVGKGAGTLATLRSFLPSGMFDRSFRSQFRMDG